MVRYARVGLPGPDVLVGQDAERLGPSKQSHVPEGRLHWAYGLLGSVGMVK